MNIAVFLFAFPVLSETFVLNELYQLQKIGVQGNIWREKSGDGEGHPKLKKLLFPIHTCIDRIQTHYWEIVKAHLWWALRFPLRYIALLCMVLRFFPDFESFKIWLKSVVTAQQVLQANSTHVYVHESDRAFMFGLCTSKLCNLPLITIFHTYYLFAKPRYIKAKVKLSAAVIFQSKYSRNLTLKKMANSAEIEKKLYVISSPGIDINFFRPSKKLLKKSETLRVLSVGRLEEAKGFEFLIEAVHLLREEGVKVSCRIVGEGSLRAELEKKIQQHSLKEDVALLGSVPHTLQLQKELWSAEYFILPSVQDSDGVHDVHPNVVKEAMAAELLVITTQLGGIDEVITNGQTGFIIPAAQPRLIADALKKVGSLSTEKKLKIKEAARKRILTLFEAEQTTQQLIDCFLNYAK